MGYASLLTYVL